MTEPKTSTAVDVRTWARDNGHEVGDRGRFSAELVTAFNEANPRRKYATYAGGAR